MNVLAVPLTGVLVLEPRVFRDERGFFLETWQQKRYEEVGLTQPFVQDNHSCSSRGVLRGIHFQIAHPQGKLISVSVGRVYDVAVDLRSGSPTFGQWYGAELSADNHRQMWIPPGLGHAFCVLSDQAHFHYKCTDYYVPGDEGGIIWNDPDLAIDWPVRDPILSAKDAAAPTLAELMRHA